MSATHRQAPAQHSPDDALRQELDGLRGEWERLRDDKIRTEQDLANLNRHMAELEELALREYGTADPQALAGLLEAKRAENERLVTEYRAHIRGVQEALSAVESQGEPGA